MRILNEQEKRDALTQILIELSKSQDILKEPQDRSTYFKRLEWVYYKKGQNFRHYYSDIFSTLTLIDGDSSIGSLDVLAQNIQTIKDEYVAINKDENGTVLDISKEILKLYDHTNLDIARINYTKTMTNETMSELAKNKLLVSELEKKVILYVILMEKIKVSVGCVYWLMPYYWVESLRFAFPINIIGLLSMRNYRG